MDKFLAHCSTITVVHDGYMVFTYTQPENGELLFRSQNMRRKILSVVVKLWSQ